MEATKPTVTEHVEQHELSATPFSSHAEPTTTVQESEAHYRVAFRTWFAITALALANCNATLSNTTNTIIRYQVQSVGGSSLASWIANGNFLLTLACAPIFGYLADRLGKLWFIVGGCALGIVGSFISSSAHDVHTIISGNILTGKLLSYMAKNTV
jgi:MFS family permease